MVQFRLITVLNLNNYSYVFIALFTVDIPLNNLMFFEENIIYK